jgi:hypothetical protein
VIGIFGGSVAAYFARTGALEAALARRPEFAGKNIVIASKGSMGGFKQPQQLFALSYALILGGEYDIVINLDGFNEVALHRSENAQKGVAAVYPRGWFARIRDLPDPELRRIIGRSAVLEEARREAARFFSKGPISGSPTWNLVWLLRDRTLAGAIGEQHALYLAWEPQDRPPVLTGPPREYASDAEMYRDLVSIWRRSSEQMERVCRANGIRYVHFLQPNQYVPGSKQMSEQERKAAWRGDYELKPDVEAAYPLLVREGEELKRAGVDFFDLTGIFQGIESPIYRDRCCHVNQQGNEILAARVAEALARAWVAPLPVLPGDPGR